MKNNQMLISILALGVFSILNTEMGIVGILPMVCEKYNIDIVQAGLLVSLFALGVAVAGPILPLLCSKFNRRKVMLWVLMIFTLCNVISIFAPSFEIMLAARIMPAFFHPVYCAMAFTVAAASAAPGEAPRAIARINMGVAGGMVIGVPVSNFLASHLNLEAALEFFAIMTAICLLLTWLKMPDMPQTQSMSYGSQLCVLRRPMTWAAIAAVIFLNGSVFGVFNYLADYLARVTQTGAEWSCILLLLYGIMNVAGSWLGGELLSRRPLATVCIFPVCVMCIYMMIWLGSGNSLALMAVLIIAWGILGGINGNINQFWLAKAVPEAPDFGNGLFLTAANVGCMAGTFTGGWFIRYHGLEDVVLGGILFAAVGLLIVLCQSSNYNKALDVKHPL